MPGLDPGIGPERKERIILQPIRRDLIAQRRQRPAFGIVINTLQHKNIRGDQRNYLNQSADLRVIALKDVAVEYPRPGAGQLCVQRRDPQCVRRYRYGRAQNEADRNQAV